MSNILIIDDDRELSDMLKEYLRPEGFDIHTVYRGDEGAQAATDKTWDAVILDVMLPGMNGIDVLRTIRRHSLVPILMLTAKGDDLDRILGLEMGADDYLPKPFNPRELAARLRAILRRGQAAATDSHEKLECRSLQLWPGSRKATIGGEILELTSTEFNVLECLIQHAGEVVSKDILYQSALGRPLARYDRSIDMHISHLRKKLSQFDEQLVIHTIRGSGYQLET
jgi:two-component system, OmpR family, response regulator